MMSDGMKILSGGTELKKRIPAIVTVEATTFNPPWTEADFRREIEDAAARYLLLVQGQTVLGYLFAKVAAGEASINKLCIHPEHRGGGLGKLLVRTFLERFSEEYARVFLEVDSGNTPAIALYEGFGFSVVRVRKKIYADGSDALEMVYRGSADVDR